MARLPRAGWLALGAITAAMLAEGGRFALPLPAGLALGLSAAIVVAGLAVAGLRRAGVAAFLVAFGSVSLRAAAAAVLAGTALATPALPAGSGEWDALVVDLSSPAGAEQRAFVRLSAGSGVEAGAQAGGEAGWLVYAWLPRHPALVPGDRVTLRGTVQPPPADAPGFADFLRSRGAAGSLKAHALELTASGGGFTATVEQLRWGIDAALSRAVPEPEAGLASGILIGLRERVSRSVADDFTVTGLTHVVAISGWNIALVAGIATGLLRAVGLGRRHRSVIVIVAIVAYTILAGAEASVIRAAVMGGVVIIARESGRPSSAAAALGIACWGLLLVEPRMIDDIGLQLSLAATAGLLALGGQAETAVGRLSRGRAPRWLRETLGVSLAAQLATLPLVLLHFGRLSLISPLANLAVAPIVPLAMLGAAVAVLLGPLLVVPS
ncbi:MAG TPA: ComEC/Rec2 family competence protein, partial [Anaerolineae bacterium]|nr:ComEC/Rec2 family competence protein [Anaerolineae bacterium]